MLEIEIPDARAASKDSIAAGRWRQLALICLGSFCALTTWFSATAVLPEITSAWGLEPSAAGWMTNAVQIGFVVGALGSSLVNLPDLIPMVRLMAVSAALAGLANTALLAEPGFAGAIALRFLTGAALAGVYPPAVKLMSTWFRRGRGLALGFLIGALSLGSSMPHLFRALTATLDWRLAVTASSLCALIACALFATSLREGPFAFGPAVFRPSQCLRVFRDRPLALANLGYFGHMWELYAMWAWFLAFATAAQAGLVDYPFGHASLFTFFAIGAGSLGCVLGGVLSDRIGRCLTTVGMMVVSGTCAVLIGFAFGGPGWLLALVALVWGASIVGDSAQFSAAVTELSDQSFVGTALALQLGIGFALTVAAIWVTPHLALLIGGWRWVFLFLLPGPVVGTWAMLRLRAMPEAARLAGGKR